MSDATESMKQIKSLLDDCSDELRSMEATVLRIASVVSRYERGKQ